MARDEGAGAGQHPAGFLLGAVSGAAVALLYAPASGTRDARVSRRQGARRRATRAADAAAKGRDASTRGATR